MIFDKTTHSLATWALLLHLGGGFSGKTKCLAGHWCCSLAKCGWQPLPLYGQRVTLGNMLFWGTLSLCLWRRLEGWADLVLREAGVFWVNTWCKTKTLVTNKANLQAVIPLFPHYSWTGMREESIYSESLSCRESLCS